MDNDSKEEKCFVCNSVGYIMIPAYKKWHKAYNLISTCDECPICDGKGYLKINENF